VIHRGFDTNDFSNQFALSISVAAAVAYAIVALLSGNALVSALIVGANAGLAVLIAWMIAREVDPDHKLSANLSALVVTGLFYFTLPAGQLMILELLLIAMCTRMIVRSSGYAFTCTDLTVIWVILLVSSYLTGSAVLAMFVGLAYAIDWLFPEGNKLAGIFMLGTLLLSAWILGWKGVETLSVHGNVWIWLILTVVILAYVFAILVGKERVHAKGDLTGRVLDWRRVLEARIWLVWSAIILSLSANLGGTSGLWVVWVVMVMIVLVSIFSPKSQTSQIKHLHAKTLHSRRHK
jgi:hypothetical protein